MPIDSASHRGLAAASRAARFRRRYPGFTMIEMIIVVAILALLTTAALPNVLETMDRSRESRTLADMKTIADALERHAALEQRYPVAKDIAGLRPFLEPRHLKELPLVDGWKHPYVYTVDETGSTYTLRSLGKDGAVQTEATPDETPGFEVDIVLQDGVFVDRPGG